MWGLELVLVGEVEGVVDRPPALAVDSRVAVVVVGGHMGFEVAWAVRVCVGAHIIYMYMTHSHFT